jgi:hypothetical protein
MYQPYGTSANYRILDVNVQSRWDTGLDSASQWRSPQLVTNTGTSTDQTAAIESNSGTNGIGGNGDITSNTDASGTNASTVFSTGTHYAYSEPPRYQNDDEGAVMKYYNGATLSVTDNIATGITSKPYVTEIVIGVPAAKNAVTFQVTRVDSGQEINAVLPNGASAVGAVSLTPFTTGNVTSVNVSLLSTGLNIPATNTGLTPTNSKDFYVVVSEKGHWNQLIHVRVYKVAQAIADTGTGASILTSGYLSAGTGNYHDAIFWTETPSDGGSAWSTSALGTITMEVAAEDIRNSTDGNLLLNRLYIPLDDADEGVTATISTPVITGGEGTQSGFALESSAVRKLSSGFFDGAGSPLLDATASGVYVVEVKPTGANSHWGWDGAISAAAPYTLVFNLTVTQPGAKPSVYTVTITVTT